MTTRRTFLMTALAGVSLMGLGVTGTWAQEGNLNVGLSGAISSVDPHFQVLSSNQALSLHFFSGLVAHDANFQPIPALAESWEAKDSLTWIFKLRQGVVFNDGTPFTAEDVLASLARAPNVANSPSSFSTYIGAIKEATAVDDFTVQIVTSRPDPLLPMELTQIMIIPAKLRDATTAQFNSGEAMIGTGPFVMTKYVPGNSIEMVRNDKYWGEAAAWPQVTMRIVSNNASRTAGLLSNDLDLIDNIAPADIKAITAAPGKKVVNIESNRLIYLMLDQSSDSSPYITGNDGKPLAANPFKDLRVRQALSMAINRDGICQRLMGGQASPASGFAPDSFQRFKNPAVTPYDPAKAKQLLADAGYADGFKLTIFGPNDRYLNDSSVLQAVAQMFSQIGIATSAEPTPWATFRPRVSNSDLSMALFGWAANTGETGPSMYSTIGTQNKEGRGVPNGGRYSNPDLDTKIDAAMTTLDNGARDKLLSEATQIAMEDVAIIPLFYPMVSWAMRDSIDYVGSPDQFTLATDARPA